MCASAFCKPHKGSFLINNYSYKKRNPSREDKIIEEIIDSIKVLKEVFKGKAKVIDICKKFDLILIYQKLSFVNFFMMIRDFETGDINFILQKTNLTNCFLPHPDLYYKRINYEFNLSLTSLEIQLVHNTCLNYISSYYFDVGIFCFNDFYSLTDRNYKKIKKYIHSRVENLIFSFKEV
jgi:hypothetical protein